MKKNCAIGLMIVVILIGISACQKAGEIIKENLQTPKVSLEDLAVTGVSSSKLDLAAKLGVDNPNPIGLNLAGLDYALELSGKPVFSGESSEGMSIAASGKSTVKVPISLTYDNLKKVYDLASGKDEIPYRLSGQVKLNTPIGPMPIPYNVSGKLPVVRAPKIAEVGLKVRNLSITEAKFDVSIKLDNPNSFPLDISKLSYQLKMDGKDFSEGEMESASIPAKSEGELTIPVSMDLMAVGNWAFNLLQKGSSDYELTYDAKYQIKDWPVKQQEKKTGTLKIKK